MRCPYFCDIFGYFNLVDLVGYPISNLRTRHDNLHSKANFRSLIDFLQVAKCRSLIPIYFRLCNLTQKMESHGQY